MQWCCHPSRDSSRRRSGGTDDRRQDAVGTEFGWPQGRYGDASRSDRIARQALEQIPVVGVRAVQWRTTALNALGAACDLEARSGSTRAPTVRSAACTAAHTSGRPAIMSPRSTCRFRMCCVRLSRSPLRHESAHKAGDEVAASRLDTQGSRRQSHRSLPA